MKKLLWYTLAALLTAACFSSCEKNKEVDPVDPSNVVATVTASNLLDAVAAAYDAWEDDTTIPASLQVGSTSLTLPQYQYAIAKLLVNLASNDKGDVKVLGFKEADHPERDSYDQKEIAVTGGPKITEGTEDLVDIAKRMLKAMEEKLTVPNQTVITRTGASALAFSTNRATVTILRALAAYKKSGSLPAKVETEYLSAAASLKGFAQQFVGILDIWEKTVGTVSADGSHCTDNNSAWQNVHFVPIPWSGGAYADGKDQYAEEYKPYFTVTIDGKEYNTAQTWGIALRGIVDMLTVEGSSKMQEERNTFAHTMGNGASLKEPIPAVTENDSWGGYPWYESTNDGPAINKDQFSPYLIVRNATWFLTRQAALGHIGNYMIFGTDPDECLVEDGVNGFVSAMRMWLIAARFYKYLLDNNITENVYDAVKNVTFATDLYGVEMPDIELKTKKVDLEYLGNPIEAKFSSKKAWTAEPSDAWIHVEPASGDPADEVVVAISADANEGEERSGSVLIKGGNVTEGLAITVNQAKYVAPAKATLKEFAQEFVKGLDVWEATVGTVESEGYHLISKGTAWENVHYIPVGHTGGGYDDHGGNQYDETLHPAWTLTVGGETYTSAQAYEIAVKGLLNMVIAEGEAFLPTMDDRNKAYTLADNKSFSELPMATPTDKAKWGGYPWYEQDDYYNTVTYNGQPIESVDINFVIKAVAWHLVRGTVATSNNSPLGNIGNFQVFDTDPGTLTLEGYLGYISPMRELLIMMRIYKYLLDNNIDSKVYSAIKDQKFSFDLYNQGVAPKVFTIKDFAQEYVKILDIWQNTTGEVVMHPDVPDETVANAHYVPSTTTISVGGKTYNTADMFETALRSYLLIRGYDGLDTEKYGKGKIPALEGGALAMSETPIPETHEYAWGSSPFNETKGNGGHLVMGSDENGEHCKVKTDILDNWAMRSLNFQKGQTITNLCGYSGGQLDGYYGCFCSQRALITYAFFFKYMLDNNLDKGTQVTDDTIIRSELLGDESGSQKVTIKDFAQEYVKILDIWQNTTGEVVMHPDVPEETVANAHYVPSTTTITVGGKVYNTADMFETALRSYLLIRGYDGLDTEKYGKGKIPALEGGALAMSETEVPETHGYTWGSSPFNETKGNGGHLVMGNDENGEHCKVKTDILDNWAMRSLNFQKGRDITNLCGYASGQLDGYYGCFCSQRALLTYAFFFKYMLDNNLDKGTQVTDDTIIRSELLGDEGPKPATLKEFAQEFVKGLEVWQNTVGTVESEGQHLIEKGAAWENVHFIPIVPNPNCEYLSHAGNQYDPKYTPWVLNVAGKEISSSQAWEIAIRGLLNLVTTEGEAFLDGMTDRNKAYTLGNNQALSKAAISTPSVDNQWGKHPWYEGAADETITYNGNPIAEVDVNFIVKVGAWHVVRSFIAVGSNSPLGMIGNFQQFGTGASTLNLAGYDGLISPMREMLVLMRIYKYMLDNNVDANVYDALKDQKFDFDLYGVK
jgi:hypothetical protein